MLYLTIFKYSYSRLQESGRSCLFVGGGMTVLSVRLLRIWAQGCLVTLQSEAGISLSLSFFIFPHFFCCEEGTYRKIKQMRVYNLVK